MAQNVVRVGDIEITQLSDGMLEFDLCNFFPTIDEKHWSPYESHLHEHKVRFNLGSYLIRGGGRTVLVDTGLGPRPAETPDVPWGQLMNDFKAKGVRPEDVDMVVMTHLHRDHVGWNLTPQGGKYVPTFPKARYWMSKKDWDTSHRADVQPTRYPNAPSCVWPLAELGLVEFMNGEHSITRELTAVPTPGHTPGHMSILVTSKGERALVLGDPDLTRQTRKALLDRLEREQILVAAGHFEAPGFGRIVRLEGRRYWRGL
jgi:glyoxylase-like metal-dependent hydrolase (beta-lactamase superfamily II)